VDWGVLHLQAAADHTRTLRGSLPLTEKWPFLKPRYQGLRKTKTVHDSLPRRFLFELMTTRFKDYSHEPKTKEKGGHNVGGGILPQDRSGATELARARG